MPNANHQGPSNGEPKKHKVKPIKKTNNQLKKNSKNKDESSIKEKVMWDSLSLNDKDDDNEDDEVIFVPTTPTNPSPDNADSEPAVDTETYQASAGTADNTEMTIAERQLAELLAGSKRGKGKGAKNQGTSKNSGKPNEKVPTLRRRVNFSNPIQSLSNMNDQDDDIEDDEVIFVSTPEKNQIQSLFNCSKCDS